MAQHTHTKNTRQHGSKRKRRAHEREHGAAFVELALSFVIFLSLFFLSVDVLRLGYHNALAQFIVTRAVQEGAILDDTSQERCRMIAQNVSQLIDDFGLTSAVQNPASDIVIIDELGNRSPAGNCDPNLPVTGGGSDTAGNPNDFIAIVLRYNVRLNVGIIFQFNHQVAGVAIARNEPEGL